MHIANALIEIQIGTLKPVFGYLSCCQCLNVLNERIALPPTEIQPVTRRDFEHPFLGSWADPA